MKFDKILFQENPWFNFIYMLENLNDNVYISPFLNIGFLTMHIFHKHGI